MQNMAVAELVCLGVGYIYTPAGKDVNNVQEVLSNETSEAVLEQMLVMIV